MLVRVKELFERGQRVGVAVSGGADSTALLTALCELRAEWEFALTVLHVNHGLRAAESNGDEAFVREMASRLGLEVLVLRPAQAAGNLEQAARDLRYAWFRELTADGQFDRIATGHTASDQAETVLFRFLRGAGTAGLAAIRPALAGGIVRPLLGATREDAYRYLRERGIVWREDSSNRDERFARNRIRHELLPALERDWNPRLTEVLNQTAEWARAEEEYWEAETPRLATECVRFEPRAAIVSITALAALPLAAARRVVRLAIARFKGDLRQIDFAHVEGILELARRESGDGAVQVPGLNVRRSFDWVRLARAEREVTDYRQVLAIPGEIPLPGGGPTLQLELNSFDSVYNNSGHQLDWELISGSLELRNWRPGDSYVQAGHASEVKLKDLFQKARIPSWERRRWPVITLGNSLIWTRSFGPAAGFARTASARMVLVIREVPSGSGERGNQIV